MAQVLRNLFNIKKEPQYEAAVVEITCPQHGSLERVRVKLKYHKFVNSPQPVYKPNMRDKGQHLKALAISERTPKEKILEVLHQHFPEATAIRLIEA